MKTVIDLNADLGEYPGDAQPLLPYITTANVAAGGHAGGGQLLIDTLAACAAHNIRAGAHPSYPDQRNFGRLSMYTPADAAALTATIAEQIRYVASEATRQGLTLTHVKAHGALYNDAMVNPAVADLLLNALATTGLDVPLMGQPGSVLHAAAKARGIGFIREGFIDRTYTDEGTLVPRTQPDAVHHDLEVMVAQARSIVLDQAVTSRTGNRIPLPIDTLCVHADTPGSMNALAAVYAELLVDGIHLQAFA